MEHTQTNRKLRRRDLMSSNRGISAHANGENETAKSDTLNVEDVRIPFYLHWNIHHRQTQIMLNIRKYDDKRTKIEINQDKKKTICLHKTNVKLCISSDKT